MDKIDTLKDLINSYMPLFMDNFGVGKSLGSTFLNVIMGYSNNRKVMLSNTPMFYLSSFNMEFIPLISTSQLSEDHYNTQINLDEMQKVANSRDSLSPRNSFVTEFSTDIRKFNQAICGTCQFGNTIDVRIYDNSDFIIIPDWKITMGKRELRTNFNTYWHILNKEKGYTETIELNLEKAINLYNTNFKPSKIIVNHDEYMDRLKETRSLRFYDDYVKKCEKEIDRNEKIFKIEMQNKK